MDWLQQSLNFADSPGLSAQTNQALRWVETWREPLVAAVLVLECVPIVGLIVPGQIILTIAGFWSWGESPLLAFRMFLACFAAVLAADMAMFALGRHCSQKFKLLQKWLGENAAFAQALSVQPFGILAFYQFPPYTRMFAPFLLGASQRSWQSWFGLCLPASFAFVLAFFGIGLGIAFAGKAALTSASLAGTASAVCALIFFIWLPIFIRRIIAHRQATKRDV